MVCFAFVGRYRIDFLGCRIVFRLLMHPPLIRDKCMTLVWLSISLLLRCVWGCLCGPRAAFLKSSSSGLEAHG